MESAYRTALLQELSLAGLRALSEVSVGMNYKGVTIDCGYRADILVEQKLLLELKTAERVLPIHHAQLLTYLKLAKLRVGLIINFNSIHLRDGIKRLVV
ncbi:MAG TPA: GxxExxY protein [Usitatibacter sp.]|nr:GxxExxY protein [Usitatibacter sp.]